MFSVWAKLKAGLAIAGAVIIAIGIAFMKGRSEGKAIIAAEQQRQRDALQKHYDEIDAGPPDLDGALSRLRKRAGGK